MVTVKGPPKDRQTIECSGCGYELEYRPGDVKTGGGIHGSDTFRYIVCPRPVCGKRTELPIPWYEGL